MDYNEIAPTLQTGDVVLFRSPSWISRLIDFITDSIYSHAAMVFRTPGSHGRDGLFLWQSYEPDGGVIVEPLEAFLAKYLKGDPGSKFVIRQLTGQRTPAMLQALDTFMAEVKGRPFPSVMTWIVHWIGGNLGIPSGWKNFFCSQLVAQTYIQMGLVRKRPPAAAYTPGRFAARYKHIPFLKGASLGPEIPVTLPKNLRKGG